MNYVEERNQSLSVSIHAITGHQRSEKQHSGSKFEEAVRVVEVQARSWWFSSSTAVFFRKARVVRREGRRGVPFAGTSNKLDNRSAMFVYPYVCAVALRV